MEARMRWHCEAEASCYGFGDEASMLSSVILAGDAPLKWKRRAVDSTCFHVA